MKKENCDNCGKEYNDRLNRKGIVFEHGYCGRECRNIHYRKMMSERPIPSSIICNDCNKETPLSECYKNSTRLPSYCKACTNIRTHKYYDENVDRIMRDKQGKPRKPNKRRPDNPAHRAVRVAIRKGTLIKPEKCSDCGKHGRLHAHHWKGYDNPLDVEWLCASCHASRHGRGPRARKNEQERIYG